ncbi:agmatine coumaroyltransferase-2-like [Panicum miliaceum]|uniref:Agmatine coumaroyltransferase-2-like n=1 Tax=Panicum miliaceum TaxID=4540 RepID=A0A3L6QBW5_PANMI|nr:agmatine coumaroyltransferase-2-like [Panicum miliaceum]
MADGRAACNFLLSWGQAPRGVPIDPAPTNDRASLFLPRDPPRVEFEHRSVEFGPPRPRPHGGEARDDADDVVVMHRVHFSRKAGAGSLSSAAQVTGVGTGAAALRHNAVPGGTPVAVRHEGARARRGRGHHAARRRGRAGADDGPPRGVPEGVHGQHRALGALWHAAELVARAVARIDDAYFLSFVDFACSGAVEREGQCYDPKTLIMNNI